MTAKEIKEILLKGGQFEIESAGWYTLSRPYENFFAIQFIEEMKFYKNIDSYSKRISKLIRTGN